MKLIEQLKQVTFVLNDCPAFSEFREQYGAVGLAWSNPRSNRCGTKPFNGGFKARTDIRMSR